MINQLSKQLDEAIERIVGDPVIYISGPMTSVPNFKQVFGFVEEVLKEHNYRLFNPAWSPAGLNYEQYMSIDLPMVASSDVLLMLPGWKNSKGATAEYAYAKALGKEIIFVGEE